MYRLIMEEPDPEKAMENYLQGLRRINSQQRYDRFLNSGFPVILRDDSRSIEQTLRMVEEAFGLKGASASAETTESIIAACGNDCAACPRYVTPPYEKNGEELRHTAELWLKIGYRDRVVSNEEIACTGCKPGNWCRYHIAACCEERGVKTCARCDAYPCDTVKECFQVTRSFEPMCRRACTREEYERLKKAFFEKEENLKRA